MKALQILKISLVVATLNFTSADITQRALSSDAYDGVLLSCVTFPWCSGPDMSSPILQPKDKKTETQDTKDNKLA